MLLLLACTSVDIDRKPGDTPTSLDSGDSPAPADPPVLADYDNEDREAEPREDGYLHVDSPLLVSRLLALGANTYAFLLYHSPSDWADLEEYLALAEPAGLRTWVYLVPPSELPVDYPPYQDDYVAWARAIGELAQRHPSITAIAMDDFNSNVALFTGDYVCSMTDEASGLKFYAVDYHPSVLGDLDTEAERRCVDGVIFPYTDLDDNGELRGQIEEVAALRDGLDAAVTLSFPWDVSSSAGDRGQLSATCGAGSLSFSYSDSFDAGTAGYHFVRVRADGELLFEEDVAGDEVAEGTTLSFGEGTVTIGLEDDLGVSNFGVVATLAGFDAPTCGAWSWSATNVAFTGDVGEVEAWPELELYPMIYAVSTSWHAEAPTPAVVGEGVDIGLQAVDDGLAQGVITYCLPKTDAANAWFVAVQERYLAR